MPLQESEPIRCFHCNAEIPVGQEAWVGDQDGYVGPCCDGDLWDEAGDVCKMGGPAPCIDDICHALALPTSSLPWPVVVDPACPHEGMVGWRLDFNGRAWPGKIILRRYDERVLLHEALHCFLATDDTTARVLRPGTPEHETLVRHLTAALWDAGWRLGADDVAS